MLADRPSINTNKTIVIETIKGQIFISGDHKLDFNGPANFIIIKDNADGNTYWLNPDHVVSIGPR